LESIFGRNIAAVTENRCHHGSGGDAGKPIERFIAFVQGKRTNSGARQPWAGSGWRRPADDKANAAAAGPGGLTAPLLRDVDLDLLGFGHCDLRQVHCEHAVLELGGYLAGVGGYGFGLSRLPANGSGGDGRVRLRLWQTSH